MLGNLAQRSHAARRPGQHFTLFDNDPHLVNTVLEGFLAVKREEIQEVAKKYLRPENRAIVFRAPVNKDAKEAA